jgi:hypothetical protein
MIGWLRRILKTRLEPSREPSRAPLWFWDETPTRYVNVIGGGGGGGGTLWGGRRYWVYNAHYLGTYTKEWS